MSLAISSTGKYLYYDYCTKVLSFLNIKSGMFKMLARFECSLTPLLPFMSLTKAGAVFSCTYIVDFKIPFPKASVLVAWPIHVVKLPNMKCHWFDVVFFWNVQSMKNMRGPGEKNDFNCGSPGPAIQLSA